MIETKTIKSIHCSEQISEVIFAKTNEQANEPAQRLAIRFAQKECRIVRLKYEHISEIKLMSEASLKPMMLRIVELNLQLNCIGDKGCKIISTVNLPKLKELNLTGSEITGKGVFHLSKILAKLSILYLSDNNIGREGVYWLTKLHSSLRLLALQTNRLVSSDLTPLLLGQSDRMSQLIFRFPPFPTGQMTVATMALGCLKLKYSSAQFYL